MEIGEGEGGAEGTGAVLGWFILVKNGGGDERESWPSPHFSGRILKALCGVSVWCWFNSRMLAWPPRDARSWGCVMLVCLGIFVDSDGLFSRYRLTDCRDEVWTCMKEDWSIDDLDGRMRFSKDVWDLWKGKAWLVTVCNWKGALDGDVWCWGKDFWKWNKGLRWGFWGWGVGWLPITSLIRLIWDTVELVELKLFSGSNKEFFVTGTVCCLGSWRFFFASFQGENGREKRGLVGFCSVIFNKRLVAGSVSLGSAKKAEAVKGRGFEEERGLLWALVWVIGLSVSLLASSVTPEIDLEVA